MPDRNGHSKLGLPLTKTQLLVARSIARGQTNQCIASSMNISIKTVEKHRQDVYKRVGVHDPISLTHYALRVGWVENIFAGTDDWSI